MVFIPHYEQNAVTCNIAVFMYSDQPWLG